MEASNGKEKTMEAFDAQKTRKILKRVEKFLGILIRENLVKDAPFLGEGELENESDLADDVWEVLQMQLRNCDVGTADEQLPRFVAAWESAHRCFVDRRSKMMLSVFSRWAQMPYEEGCAK